LFFFRGRAVSMAYGESIIGGMLGFSLVGLLLCF
jgi:hypothetical protein